MATKEETIANRLESARRELLDLGLRNPLLNYRLLKARGLEAIGEAPAKVFNTLVRESRNLSFLPVDSVGTTRRSDTRLQTSIDEEELHSRLLKTFHWSNTYVQDHGANILFIGLGMLKWYESDSSNDPKYAPLVLIPVEVQRANIQDRFHLSYTGEDIGANLSLVEKACADFRVEIPELPEDEEDLDIESYFDSVSSAVSSLTRWSVDSGRIVLGFFSFAKFLMYRDLDVGIWPEEAKPTEHKIIQSLLHDGFREPESAIGDGEFLDDHLSPSQVHNVVDADSSQMLAIDDVMNGRNIVIQGPPGTGKSQTITNLIAEAIGQGKRVLFVSEKMAALEVVKRRLDSVGLGEACLELHSHKTTKKAVLDELERTLNLGKPVIRQAQDDFDELGRLRKRLNDYAKDVNNPVADSGITPVRAYGELASLRDKADGKEMPRIEVPGIASWNGSTFRKNQAIVEELQARVSAMGVPSHHPFWGCQLRLFLPSDRDRLVDQIQLAKDSLTKLVEVSLGISNLLDVSVTSDISELELILETARRILSAPDLDGVDVQSRDWSGRRSDFEDLISSGREFVQIHRAFESTVIPAAWEQDLLHVRQALIDKDQSWLRIFSGEYKRSMRILRGLCVSDMPAGPNERLALVDGIMESQRLVSLLDENSEKAAKLFGARWIYQNSDWDDLKQILDYLCQLYDDMKSSRILPEATKILVSSINLEELLQKVEQCQGFLKTHVDNAQQLETLLQFNLIEKFDGKEQLSDLPLFMQEASFTSWDENVDDIHQIIGFNTAADVCKKEGLGAIADKAASWEHAGENLVDAVKQAWYEKILEQAFKVCPALATFDGPSHQQQVDRFQEMDSLVIELNRSRLALQHWESLPKYQEAGGQLGLLQREFQKKRRHLPIQRLMKEAGNAIQAIKPVFMMSPLSIASYLPPGHLEFDLVIFDEASQVKPVDALGAIMRGRQAVVVGDNQQLPPTNFFDSLNQEDDQEEDDFVAADIESVLRLFLAQGAPSKMLHWHYRSLHESLIAVSNREFYGNELVVFPSPDSAKDELGLKFHHIPDAVYDRGASRTNKVEAKAVAEAVMQHAKNFPRLSLGVAAFSAAQMNAIEDQLEIVRSLDPSNEGFFASHPFEPFFIKNLESVQGDERDVIFISVGYGHDGTGRRVTFSGPLTSEGGHRRLNVLITRAKRRCEIFSGITGDDINAENSTHRGVPALKTFLNYAEKGIIELPEESHREVESPFQQAVATELGNLGYEIKQEIGTAGYFIDLAVVDPAKPGRYLIGIECDGATYHSSRSARDRDRLRAQVLKNRGWQLHRIWSTDWFKNPQRELTLAAEAIEAAKLYSPANDKKIESAESTIIRDDVIEPESSDVEQQYEMAKLAISLGNIELHTVSRNQFADLIAKVVDVESPVHVNEVARRIANAAGVRRVASRIQQAIGAGLQIALKREQVAQRGAFLWRVGAQDAIVRSRRSLPGSSRKIDLIAPEEIMSAVLHVVSNSYGIDRIDVPPRVSRLFGFQRATEDICSAIDDVVNQMLGNQLIGDDGSDHLSKF